MDTVCLRLSEQSQILHNLDTILAWLYLIDLSNIFRLRKNVLRQGKLAETFTRPALECLDHVSINI
jgi:hypothetical protein